jgi:hypothetical protein
VLPLVLVPLVPLLLLLLLLPLPPLPPLLLLLLLMLPRMLPRMLLANPQALFASMGMGARQSPRAPPRHPARGILARARAARWLALGALPWPRRSSSAANPLPHIIPTPSFLP